MAGKSYTMREMKGIVEYLTERQMYGEIRGRKMWIEFANSDKTTRTWQSLKETFLKRILPDIQNPYYKLTQDQVRSFRQGYDVAEREKSNRLEFRTTSGESNGIKKRENQNDQSTMNTDIDAPTASNKNVKEKETNQLPVSSIDEALVKATGEDATAAMIESQVRFSDTDTVVLEYENADDIRRDLESPQNSNKGKAISLKDKLTFEYSAPLTPAIRDLLDDFETESEGSDKESKDGPPSKDTNHAIDKLEHSKSEMLSESDVVEIIDTDNDNTNDINNRKETTRANERAQKTTSSKTDKALENVLKVTSSNNDKIENNDHVNANENNISNHNQHDRDIANKNTNDIVIPETRSKTHDKTLDETKNISTNTIPYTGTSTQNNSDTLIPNNQEAFYGVKASQKSGQDRNKVICTPVIEFEDSSKQEPASKENKNTEQATQNVIEINDDTSNSNNTNTDQANDLKTTTKKTDEPSTGAVEEITTSNVCEEKQNINDDVNPCLISVSLFEEQFNNTQYSDSEPEEVQPQQKQVVAKDAADEKLDKFQAEINKEAESHAKSEAVTNKNKNIETVQSVSKTTKDRELNQNMEITDKPQEEAVKNTEAKVKTVDTEALVLENAETDILDSSSDDQPQPKVVVKKVQHVNSSANPERERAIANVFGFANGGPASTGRKRRSSYQRRKHPTHHNHHHHRRHSRSASSNSSEWTSESDSDYISPPQGHRHRNRRYLKPRRSRIVQEAEEGRLYVIIGKNVYPVVRESEEGLNYVKYVPGDNPVDGESYWKQKYVEEKQRAEEDRKLLKEFQKNSTQIHDRTETSDSRNTAPKSSKKPVVKENIKESVDLTEEKKPESKDEKMVLKIATKSGLEYSLEGGWNQISNAMPQVVQMLHSEATNNGRSKATTNGPESKVPVQMEVRSEETAPVEKEVKEKVKKIESEIFSEIEALDKEDEQENNGDTKNITKRKAVRRRNKSSTSSIMNSESLAKRLRTTKTSSTDSKQESFAKAKRVSKTQSKETEQMEVKEVLTKSPKGGSKTEEQKESTEDNETEKPKRRGRYKKVQEITEPETIEAKKSKTKIGEKLTNSKSPSRSSSRLSKQRDLSVSSKGESINAGSRTSMRQHRTPQKFDAEQTPSKEKLPAAKSSTESTEFIAFEDENVRFMFPHAEASTSKTKQKTAGKNKSPPEIYIIPPPDELKISIDSSHGYLDSDGSPLKIILPKRRRKVTFTARKIISHRRLTRRRSLPALLEACSTESSNSSYFIPQRRSLIIQTSDCDLPAGTKNISRSNLERIDEHYQNEPDGIRYFNSVSKDSLNSSVVPGEIGSSSNISLPLSPELSVVENLSISREMIKGNNHPTINEIQQNNRCVPMDYTDYMMSNVDISVPLMDQGCHVQNNTDITSGQNKTDVALKDCTVNLTLSKSLDQKMRDLLLESAQKMIQPNGKQTAMEVDQTPITAVKKSRPRNRKINVDMTMDVDQSKTNTTKKTRAKKRSSTPQKKKLAPKSKSPIDSVIEEEHKECCSGRRSCPPVMDFVPVDENANNCSDVTLPVAKPKQKKDIIKVKIQRPGGKTGSKKRDKSPSQGSVCTDSGINDTGTILLNQDSSVDLIHNHSETCLMANECMAGSLEFVDISSNSIISVDSSRPSEDSVFYRLFEESAVLSEGTSNCRDSVNRDQQAASDDNFQTADTVFLSPVMTNSSLITEDLSNSPSEKPSKWYLLDEDITNQEQESASYPSSFGSNLKHIFPLACAVPNLSTISEMSKENEDSRKATYFD